MTARRLATIVFRGRYWAAAVLPVCLVAGTLLAGGGLLMAGFTLLALPLAALLALPPSLGSWLGKMRRAADVPLPYALVTIALWLAVLPVGFLMTYTQPVPSYATVPPGHAAAEAASAVVGPAVLVLWVAQLVLALVGVRARRPSSGLDRSATAPGSAAAG